MKQIWRSVAVAVVALLLAAGCGGGEDGGNGGGGVDLAPGELEALGVDNCALLTDAEVSELAGKDLVVDEDTPLGCGWVIPGESMHQFGVRSLRGGGDSAAAAEVLVIDPQQIIDLEGVGDDAVAVLAHGEVIDWVIARQGNLFVVLNTTFLLLHATPEDLERSGRLAATALGRLVDAA